VKTVDRFRSWHGPKGVTYLLSAAVLLSGALAPVVAQARGELGIALGERPELVEIEDMGGNKVTLAQYVGQRPVLIEFWARWCELCEALYPQMEDVHARYGDRVGFVVIAVAVAQSQRSVLRHLEDKPMGFPVLWDEGGRAVRAFLAPGTSYIVVLDTEGTVVYTGSGADQDIEAAVLRGLATGD
jgi:thiol-disulfide isomerase/thioredoxin